MRHGCLLLIWAAPALGDATPPPDRQCARVRSKVFDIEYRVTAASQPLDSVRLWYTQDKGESWQLYGQDEDRQPPIQFHTPAEGLYGFYLQVTNAAGPSGPEPKAGTTPQHWAFVDYTLPIVQVHRPQPDPRATGQTTVSIRWTAIDANLSARPIQLDYRTVPEGEWQAIARNLANTGRFDWRVPEGLEGRIVARATVVDRAGNLVQAGSPFDLLPPEQPAPGEQLVATLTSSDGTAVTPQTAEIDEATRQRSRRLYQQGVWHRDRGEVKLAMARLRDALGLDPGMSIALVDLAGLLYEEEDYEAAAQAYKLSLDQNPGLRSALEGMARVNIARRQYDDAAEYLRRIINRSPTDAQAWLDLGDVGIYRGDELFARDCYQKAASIDPQALEIITRARIRLENISDLRGRYQQVSTPR